MSKIILIILVVAAVSLIGASVVFAQDGTQTTPGAGMGNMGAICPNGGTGPNGTIGNIEQMQERHAAMTANVPAEMQERHAAMGEALASGDTERIQQLRSEMHGGGGCQNRNAQ